MKWHTLKGYLAGCVQTAASGVYCSDKYGSLDGYIEHLRTPGVWTQVPLWAPIIIGIAATVYYFVEFVKEQHE